MENATGAAAGPRPAASASTMAKTTTISTIAVQSGRTRIVIALLHVGDWMRLKVLEVAPDLASLGANLAEALDLQKAHDEVLRQLQNKQSPVEELLRQADQLIATQKPRAEVYAAMAESLGAAWRDINASLELRRQILDLNVQYHTKAQEFFQKMDELEQACADTVLPIELEAVRGFLGAIHELRRSLLEALMGALQAGNGLLGKLRALGAEGSDDSRPDRLRASVARAISQVQGWMDELHLKRQVLEATFSRRKGQLEQCLALAMLATDLHELEDTVRRRRELLANTDQLGDSSSSAELLLHEHRKLLPEAQQLQEKALKLTKATEQLVTSGCFAGDEATEQSYSVLSTASDYLADLQGREALLNRTIAFFQTAQAALAKLDQLELQLTAADLPATSPQLAELHARCAALIEEASAPPIAEGYSILDVAGGEGRAGTDGVKRMIEALVNRKVDLDRLCVAHKEENTRINKALNHFLEKHYEIHCWLLNIAEAFLQGHRDMGTDLPTSKDFLDLHNQLLGDLQVKGNEINTLLLTLPPVLEFLEDNQRKDVDRKVEQLHECWIRLKNILENRLDLSKIYLKFHMEVDIVDKEMDSLRTQLENNQDMIDDESVQKLEEKWESLVPLFQSAKNTGLTFTNQTSKVSEPYLDTKRACECVDSVLDRLTQRQLVVKKCWQTFHTSVVEKRELLVTLEETMAESSKTVNWVAKLDAQLYPILKSYDAHENALQLENKIETVLPDIKKAQFEVEQRIQTTEALIAKAPAVDEKALNVKNKLAELNQKLIDISSDYQSLLQDLVEYFNRLVALQRTTASVAKKIDTSIYPKDSNEVDFLIRVHETSKETVLEMFKCAHEECEKIIQRINKQEPPQAAEQDIQKVLHTLELQRDRWENEWKQKRDALEGHRQLCQFNADLQQIDESLEDLGQQLRDVRDKFGESLVTAKATSQAFVYFEKTVDMLEQRIETFVVTGEKLLAASHVDSPHIQSRILDLQDRWSGFRAQTRDTRGLINLSIKYFQLIDEAHEWFSEGSRLLVAIAKKTAAIATPAEAQALLEEILFLKPGEERQMERIGRITELAKQIYGPECDRRVGPVIEENRGMLESIADVTNELHSLAERLKVAAAKREIERQEQNEKASQVGVEQAPSPAAAVVTNGEEPAAAAAALVNGERGADEGPGAQPPVFTTPLSDAVIQEGSQFAFICRVAGSPRPEVTWMKDSLSIQGNPDYRTSYTDDGLCTLTIEETFADDSARYTCQAANAAGTCATSASLSVKEAEPEEQMAPPAFVTLLEPGVAKENGTFRFCCKVEGNPLPTVQWFKNAECIDNLPQYNITYNNGEAILAIERAQLGDKAEYTCKASNELGLAQTTANLSVSPLEPMEAPKFITPLSNVMARAGQKIKLECEVSGLPPPILTWSHNDKAVKETRELKLQFEGGKATLAVFEAFPKDAGTYVVHAKNAAGEATSACSVSVKGRLPTETSDSELASDMEPVKPSIQLPLNNVSVIEGQRVRLDCVIVGQPEPEVIWYHGDRPVKESPDFQLLFQGDRCSLIIQEALAEDAGVYKVVALNSAGEASSRCCLLVTPVASADPPLAQAGAGGCAPRFTKLLADVLASEGEAVVFEGVVAGEPRPEVKWLLNNQPIADAAHKRCSHDGDGTIKLQIEHVLPADKGVYTVKAANAAGEAKCFAQLIVKSAKVPETVRHEEAKSAPVFTERFNDKVVLEDTATKFECIVAGRPAPRVKWLFNGDPISGKDFLVSTSGDRQVLAVPNAKREHGGMVTCVAENEAGKASCAARLCVEFAAPTTLPQLSKQLEQHIESSYIVNREVRTQTATSTSSKLVTASSEAAEPHVQVHSFAEQNEKIVKQVNDQPAQVTGTLKIEEFRQVDEEPTMHEKSSSTFVIGPEAKVESAEIVVQKPVVVKTRPPKFVTPVIGRIVDQDVPVVLEGILDGQPTPQVVWTKNGAQLQSGDHVRVSYAFNRAAVEIRNVRTDDAGRYTCTAVNEAGKAISTADLVVRKTVFPPVFGRRLQAQIIKKGDRVNLEVEVTGTPDPTIQWFKDDVPIETALKDNYKIRSIGNSHTLVVEKADMNLTGKYMVRAVNSGGEAQSIADIAVFEPTPDTMMEVVKTVVFEDVRKHETLTSATDKFVSTVSAAKSAEPPNEQTKPAEPPREQIRPAEPPIAQQQKEHSKSEFGTKFEQTVSKEYKTFKLEHTVPEVPPLKPFELTKPAEPFVPKREFDIPKPSQIVHETTEIQDFAKEEAGIETSSISKQSSLQYFVKKIKQGEEPVVASRETVPEQIKPEVYRKFEDMSHKSEFAAAEAAVPVKMNKFVEEPPKIYKPFTPVHSDFQTQYQSYQKTSENLILQPEPPAELCYMPPTKPKLQDEKPLPPPPPPMSTFQEKSYQTSSFTHSMTTSPKPQPVRPVSTGSLYPMTERQSVPRPFSAVIPEPSVEGLQMEKAWAHKFSEIQSEKHWPPSQTELPKITPSWSVQSTLEKKWTPVAEVKTEKIEKEWKSVEVPIKHYVAKVSHPSHLLNEQQQQTTSSYTESRQEFNSSFGDRKEEYIIEERNVKPSQMIKSWPPPSVQQEILPKPVHIDSLPIRPVSVQDITDEIYLEPGPPPEIGFAQPPPSRERRLSYVEMVEQDLEKNLEKLPDKVPPGAIRTIPPPKERYAPPPLPPKFEQPQAPPIPAKPLRPFQPAKKVVEIQSHRFERFPDLEPFPFQPAPEQPKPPKSAPPPTPSKFVKGKFTDSDYESDFEAVKFPTKWKTCTSDTEELSFKKVQPPQGSAIFGRSKSVEHEPLPPSKFEKPSPMQGALRPHMNFERYKKDNLQQTNQQFTHYSQSQNAFKQEFISNLKPGSPPLYIEVERKKPDSPKFKQTTPVDGYMADTDEPFIHQQNQNVTKSEYRHEESTEIMRSEHIVENAQHKFYANQPQVQHKFPQYKKHAPFVPSPKKEFVATPIITKISTEKMTEQQEKRTTSEPFPYKPSVARAQIQKGPPPPSPSKFVKGEFRESDYESDYESKTIPVWGADVNGPCFKPVRPVLTAPQAQIPTKTPTPPTEFEQPAPVDGPARPKFEPIEKLKPNQIFKPSPKPVLYRPKALPATPFAAARTAPAPAAPQVDLKPGTPPEIAFAPGPQATQYYQSVTTAPYHNAVQTETSNLMHFNESSENCHRTMSLQQTTKVIKFGDKKALHETKLEPFPFKPEGGPRRQLGGAPPPPIPKKFVKGEFRESDYESEIESVRIRPVWAPYGSDSEGHRFRSVKAPMGGRSSSVPPPRERVLTPMEFDQPPVMPSKIAVIDSVDGTGLQYRKFVDNKGKKLVTRSRSYEPPVLQPGSPPEYSCATDQSITKSQATNIASHHMDSMTQAFKNKTQKFVNDIMGDVNKQQKPILKPADADAQIYREESRASQYGTKHVDPDTGLIYFKYDFGYEFGIVLPGESRQGEIPTPKKTIIEPPKRTSDIEMPVYHETSSKAPQPLRPKKFGTNKNVKWEPTSESEMSEYEGDASKRLNCYQGSRWESSCSPVSLSPSLPSTSPAFNSAFAGPGRAKGAETPPSCPSTPGSSKCHPEQARAPMFITPLRDIAVVSGQSAKFECIVQSEPPPNVLWSKNGRIIENSNDYQLHYRNGVCRLTISQAYPEDAGTYSCTASNSVGTATTTATLQVPGERRSAYIH